MDAIVADYFQMLCKELQGRPYSKAAHRRGLVERLPGRNAGAVQKKYHTLSAALLALALPSIKGYKPLDNYQTLLIEAIDCHLERHPEIMALIMAHAGRPLSAPMQREFFFKDMVVDPPRPRGPGSGKRKRLVRNIAKKYTFVRAEAQNPNLTEAGLGFVVDLEKARLREEGAGHRTDHVKRLDENQTAGRPYDIRSVTRTGKPLWIKVKATSCGRRFPFSLSAAELVFSSARPDGYRLYRLFDFPENPRLFILTGRLHDWVHLTPEAFTARFE